MLGGSRGGSVVDDNVLQILRTEEQVRVASLPQHAIAPRVPWIQRPGAGNVLYQPWLTRVVLATIVKSDRSLLQDDDRSLLLWRHLRIRSRPSGGVTGQTGDAAPMRHRSLVRLGLVVRAAIRDSLVQISALLYNTTARHTHHGPEKKWRPHNRKQYP